MTPETMAARIMQIALYGGWVVFVVLFTVPRLIGRASRAHPRPVARASEVARSRASYLGIACQALGFATVWFIRRDRLTPVWPAMPRLDWVVAVAVCLLMAVSIALVVSAIRALGRQWSLGARVLEGHELVTSGSYAWVRHPIYTGMGGFLLATGLVLSPAWALLAALVAYGLGTRVRVATEDTLLARRFGEAFAAYRARVPSVLPGWHAR